MDGASKATLENEFGTTNDEEVIKQILEKGSLQESEVRNFPCLPLSFIQSPSNHPMADFVPAQAAATRPKPPRPLDRVRIIESISIKREIAISPKVAAGMSWARLGKIEIFP